MVRTFLRTLQINVIVVLLIVGAGIRPAAADTRSPAHGLDRLPAQQQAMVVDLERRTFRWFWQSADPQTGLVPDSYPGQS
ncbi:Tat pathway signal protein, partial [Rhodanobacter denitrificans]|nr:Tat pathway signal protein [Rhodanobacter denitrificans]